MRFGCVCGGARVSAAPRHSWLGCWGVCVFVYALRLYPATPGSGVRCGCVFLNSGFGCAPPLLAGVVGGCAWVWCVQLGLGFGLLPAVPGRCFGVVVCLGARSSSPLRHSWQGCVGVDSGFGCAPPLLAGVLGYVCVCVRAPLVPRHFWLSCAVWVYVLRLRPATQCWGVGVCVCLGARSACTLQLLALVCGVGVCAWARVDRILVPIFAYEFMYPTAWRKRKVQIMVEGGFGHCAKGQAKYCQSEHNSTTPLLPSNYLSFAKKCIAVGASDPREPVSRKD